MTENTSIFSEDGTEIPLFSKDYTYFLNKSIILYGSSGSGKSMIMRDILYILKDHIPNILVIAPTNHLNNSFDDIIPPQLIFPDVTEELIQNIFKRQKTVVKLYNMVNDYQRLENIYNEMKTFIKSSLTVKFGGATGEFNALKCALPDTNWQEWADHFICEDFSPSSSLYEGFSPSSSLYEGFSPSSSLVCARDFQNPASSSLVPFFCARDFQNPVSSSLFLMYDIVLFMCVYDCLSLIILYYRVLKEK